MMVDRLVGTGLLAHAALDALLLVDHGALVLERDRLLRTYFATRVRQTTLARVRNLVFVIATGIACELDHVDQRRVVVRVGHRGIAQAFAHARRVIDALQIETHGQANALLDDGTLQEHALAIGGNVARNDVVRELLEATVEVLVGILGVLGSLVYDFGNLGKYATTDVGKVGVDATHSVGHRTLSSRLVPASSSQRPAVTPPVWTNRHRAGGTDWQNASANRYTTSRARLLLDA